jgi:hypothetical protein
LFGRAAGPAWQATLDLWAHEPGHVAGCERCSRGPKADLLLFLNVSITELLYSIKYPEICISFPKFIENKIQLIKIQNKIL